MVVDTLLTVPGLLVLIIIADSIKGVIDINLMALVVASLAWMHPTRTIRSQVLTLRERAYVQMAKLSGMSGLEIIVRELVPNLLPYLAASFVGAVAGAVLASIGLEALGLGPQNEPTIGMTIYWAIAFNALLRGLWWWWVPPIVVIVVLFIGPVPAQRRTRRDRQSAAAEGGLIDAEVLQVRDLRVYYHTPSRPGEGRRRHRFRAAARASDSGWLASRAAANPPPPGRSCG